MLISKGTDFLCSVLKNWFHFQLKTPMWSVFCQHIGAFVSCLENQRLLPLNHSTGDFSDWITQMCHPQPYSQMYIEHISNCSYFKSFEINHMQIKINACEINKEKHKLIRILLANWFHNWNPHLIVFKNEIPLKFFIFLLIWIIFQFK